MSTNEQLGMQWELWDEKELAERLGVSVRTVQGWRSRGGGPKWIKLGGAVRYRPATVMHWMEQMEEASVAKVAS